MVRSVAAPIGRQWDISEEARMIKEVSRVKAERYNFAAGVIGGAGACYILHPGLSVACALVFGVIGASKEFAVRRMENLIATNRRNDAILYRINQLKSIIGQQIVDLEKAPSNRVGQVTKKIKSEWSKFESMIYSLANGQISQEIDQLLDCRTNILDAKAQKNLKVKDIVLQSLRENLQEGSALSLLFKKHSDIKARIQGDFSYWQQL